MTKTRQDEMAATDTLQLNEAVELNDVVLDQVVGAGVIVDQRRGTASARQQEQQEKATSGDGA